MIGRSSIDVRSGRLGKVIPAVRYWVRLQAWTVSLVNGRVACSKGLLDRLVRGIVWKLRLVMVRVTVQSLVVFARASWMIPCLEIRVVSGQACCMDLCPNWRFPRTTPYLTVLRYYILLVMASYQ